MEKKDQLLNNFISKYDEAIKALDVQCMLMETTPEDKAIVNVTFRIVHTIKGDASFFGLFSIRDTANAMEEMLSNVRLGLMAVDSDVVDFLWAGVALLGVHLAELKASGSCSALGEQHEVLFSIVKDIKQQFEKTMAQETKSKDIEMLYWYDGVEFTDEIVKIKKFVDELKEKKETVLDVEDFMLLLDSLTEKLSALKDKTMFSVVCSLRNDFDMLVEDDAEISEFLRVQIIEAYNVLCASISATPKETKKETKSFSSIAGGVKNIVESSFRIEEERVDEVLAGVRRLDDVENSLRELQSGIVAGTEEFNPFVKVQELLNKVIFINQDLFQLLIKLKLVSPDNFMQKNSKLIESLAHSSGKKVKVVTNIGVQFVERKTLEILEGIFLHVIRNCIDHGIETSQERIKSGKDEVGSIMIDMFDEDGFFIVVIEDDGRGIDIKRVKDNAFEKGIISAGELKDISDDEAMNLLFKPGFTTSDSVGRISGRGVGLDVVYHSMRNCGGKIKVLSTLGKNTRFVLQFPSKIGLE